MPFSQNASISGEPFTPRRIQEAVKAALQSVAKNPLPRSEKGAKRHSGETLVTPEKKKPRSPNLQKVRPGCREDLKALKGLDGNGASDNDELTPDEYGPDGKTKPDALEAKRVREEARKNFSPNTSDDRDFEKQEKDFNYYKGIFLLLCLHFVHFALNSSFNFYFFRGLQTMQTRACRYARQMENAQNVVYSSPKGSLCWEGGITSVLWCVHNKGQIERSSGNTVCNFLYLELTFLVIVLLPFRETPNKVARALLKAVCSHDELMTKSLLGRSGPKNNETRLKDPFPALDKRKKQAIIGGCHFAESNL